MSKLCQIRFFSDISQYKEIKDSLQDVREEKNIIIIKKHFKELLKVFAHTF